MADVLKRINGVGAVLEKRLLEAGFDSYAKLAQSRPEDLASLPGVNLEPARRIIEQAARIEGQKEIGFQGALNVLMPICERLINEIQGLALAIQERDPRDVPKKHHRQIEKEIERIFSSLKAIKSNLIEDMTRVGKGVAKADRKIAELEGLDDPNDLRKGLKKVRKKLEKALGE